MLIQEFLLKNKRRLFIKTKKLSDEQLVKLHRNKKINAFFPLYSRYHHYGLSIVYSHLSKCGLLQSLNDEKESIVFEAINESIKSFNESKGSFKSLFSNVCMHLTLACANKFSKDPLADYISLDDNMKLSDEMTFMDSGAVALSNDEPIKQANELKVVRKTYKGKYQRRIQRMIEMKRDGFSYKEIGIRYQMSSGAVRAIFYRLKIRMNKVNKK